MCWRVIGEEHDKCKGREWETREKGGEEARESERMSEGENEVYIEKILKKFRGILVLLNKYG